MSKYEVKYVYVGALEKQRYPQERLAKFSSFMDLVYGSGGVEIYKIREP